MKMKKEQAQADFVEMIKISWTYGKLTEQEKENALTALWNVNSLRGNYQQRWDFLNDIYTAFLLGAGYDDYNWRSENETF